MRNNGLCRRNIVLKYGEGIDDITRTLRRWLAAQVNKPEEEDIVSQVEDQFFASEFSRNVAVCEIKVIIDCVFRRISNKYGILNELLIDSDVNEIMVNGPGYIYVEKKRSVQQVDDAFTSETELEEVIRMFASDVHREVNEANPIVDARLPSGYRVNGVLKNIALNGPILTIRKFSESELELKDLINYGSLTGECARDLSALVISGYNIFISGGTSSGKTTFLNALASAINEHERAIIIEDSAELRINHLKNIVHLECRSSNSIGRGEVSMEQLIRTSLRMRPDRIIVGEVRGKEVVDMIQAMNTGHEGSLSTGHGNSIKGMLNRLETMYLMDAQIPMYSVKNQIANAVDIFIHLKRDSSGRRRVVEVAELVGFDGNEYDINYLYNTESNGCLKRTASGLKDRDRLKRCGFEDLLLPSQLESGLQEEVS